MSSNEQPSEDSRGNVKWQMIAGIIATLSSVAQGTTLSLSAIILPQVQVSNSTNEALYLTSEQGSWFASLYSLGYLSGALIGGFQSDFFGRKRSMMIDNVIVIVGASLIVTSKSYYMLLSGRYLGGYGIGSCMTSLPAYLSEISHPKVRGTLTGIFGAMYYVGSFLLTTLGAFLPWRTVTGICISVPIITIIGLSFCPESPIWLLRHNKKDEALKTLIHFRGSEEAASTVLASMEDNLSKQKRCEQEKADPTLMLTIQHHIRDISCPTFWKPFVLIMFLFPIVQNWAGMPFVTFYMVTFFKNMKTPMDPYLASSTLCLIRLIFGLCSVRLLTKFSRKKIYLCIFVAMIFANASLAVHQYLYEKQYFKNWQIEDSQAVRWIPFASIVLLYGSVSLGFGTITRTLQGELLPANKRSFGSGIIGFFDGLSIFTVVKVSPALSELIHVYGCFTLFTIDLIIGVTVTYFFLPETKGRSLEEIEKYYYNMKMSKRDKNKPPSTQNNVSVL